MNQDCPLPVIVCIVILFCVIIWGIIVIFRSKSKALPSFYGILPPPKPGDFRIVELEDGRFSVQQYANGSWEIPDLTGPIAFEKYDDAVSWMHRCYQSTHKRLPIKRVITRCPK